jgi:hypothetical protein
MIDFIVIVADIEFVINQTSYEPIEWKELKFFPRFKKGILIGYESEYKGLRIVLYYNKIEISNSLHKFYKGNNYSDFSYSELRKAIEMICRKFQIEANYWKIKKMEFGFCIITPQQANQYPNNFLEYGFREFEKMKHKLKDYGRKCFLYEYALKVYDKNLHMQIMDKVNIPDNKLRIEFCYNQKRRLPTSIKTLEDLLDRNKFKNLFDDFYKAFEKVIYADETDFTGSTQEERMLFFASLKSDFFKVEEKINKDEIKTIKSKIKQVRERFLKKEFKLWFLKSLKTKYIELYCS